MPVEYKNKLLDQKLSKQQRQKIKLKNSNKNLKKSIQVLKDNLSIFMKLVLKQALKILLTIKKILKTSDLKLNNSNIMRQCSNSLKVKF